MTSATPELAPAGIDKTAVVDSNPTTSLPDSIDGLLNEAPTSSGVADPTQLITYWGNLKDLGLDYGWGTTSFFESLMEFSYLNLEMGWTGAIVASAFALRTIMFIGFQRASSDSLAKVAAMKPVLQPLMDKLEEAKREGDDAKVENLKMQQQAVMKQIGPDMFKNLLTPVAQMAFGFGAFRCLNGMAALPAPGMTSESFLWISNLTVSDPYFILPGMVGGILYVVMKVGGICLQDSVPCVCMLICFQQAGGETGVANRTTMTSMQKNVMKGLPVVMACITAFQPAALQFYFVVSSILGGVTGYILRQPAARRFLRIRALPSKESEQLYSKVVKGEVPLETLRGPDGRVRYQAPRKKASSRQFSSKPTLERTTLKPGLVLPPHMAAPSQNLTPADKELMDRDFDYNDGMSGSLSDKFDWIKRNYKPSFVVKRTWRAMSGDNRDIHVIAEQRKREKAKSDAAKYEVERKRRFEGR